jgi:hypothetical protein
MKREYYLIEDYNNLSKEEKETFKMLFERTLLLEENDLKNKKQKTEEILKLIRLLK